MLRRLKFRRARERGAAASLESTHFVVLDTELTSLDHRSNRLLSIGAIAMEGTAIRLGRQFYRVVNPGVTIPAPGILVHRLRTDDVVRGDPPRLVLEELRAFLEGAVLVGHFLGIDLKALRKELDGAGHTLDNPAVDTARVHRWLLSRQQHGDDLGHRLEDVSLASLARTYGLQFRESHHALDDAFLTAQLWQKLMALLTEHGIHDLDALLRIGRA